MTAVCRRLAPVPSIVSVSSMTAVCRRLAPVQERVAVPVHGAVPPAQGRLVSLLEPDGRGQGGTQGRDELGALLLHPSHGARHPLRQEGRSVL